MTVISSVFRVLRSKLWRLRGVSAEAIIKVQGCAPRSGVVAIPATQFFKQYVHLSSGWVSRSPLKTHNFCKLRCITLILIHEDAGTSLESNLLF